MSSAREQPSCRRGSQRQRVSSPTPSWRSKKAQTVIDASVEEALQRRRDGVASQARSNKTVQSVTPPRAPPRQCERASPGVTFPPVRAATCRPHIIAVAGRTRRNAATLRANAVDHSGSALLSPYGLRTWHSTSGDGGFKASGVEELVAAAESARFYSQAEKLYSQLDARRRAPAQSRGVSSTQALRAPIKSICQASPCANQSC